MIAEENSKIVGYCFGEFFIEKTNFSYIKPGTKCFRMLEIYVSPKFRNKGIGKKLFDEINKKVKSKCKYIVLSTTTKDYKKILNFYTEKVEMDFHSAFLIKKVGK